MNVIYTDNLKHKAINLNKIESIEIDISEYANRREYSINFRWNGRLKSWSFKNKEELLETFKRIMIHCKATNISEMVTL